MNFTNQKGLAIVLNIADIIIDNREYLSEIDGAIGDGDHGINMAKGFSIAKEEILKEDVNMSQAFKIVADVLMNKIGGSMGPLYGSFFRGLAFKSKNIEDIDKLVIMSMLEKAYSNIKMISEAKVNDKTLIDVLDPSILAYKESIEKGSSLVEALQALMLAADIGLESTKNMVAKIGRASRLGPRSVGHQDAGATSCNLILKTFASSIVYLLKEENDAKNN